MADAQSCTWAHCWIWNPLTVLSVQTGVVFVSAITLLPLFWRGCEARARGQIYLHLLKPAVKLSLKIEALDRLGNPHLYCQFLAKFLAKFLHRRKCHSPLSRSRKLTGKKSGGYTGAHSRGSDRRVGELEANQRRSGGWVGSTSAF